MQYLGHPLRHEIKYYINTGVYYTLRTRLKTVLQPDPNMVKEDGYLISSVYFDDVYNSAMQEKQSGTCFRKKFRIRSYDRCDKVIKLECKHKFGEYISKTSASLNREEYDSILSGNYDFLLNRKETVCKELAGYHKVSLMKPVVVVEYLREAYIMHQGNVRITFDKDISSSIGELDMFREDCATRRVLQKDLMVLEVKFDEFIPKQVLDILRTEAMTDRCAISKYVMCRSEKGRSLFR